MQISTRSHVHVHPQLKRLKKGRAKNSSRPRARKLLVKTVSSTCAYVYIPRIHNARDARRSAIHREKSERASEKGCVYAYIYIYTCRQRYIEALKYWRTEQQMRSAASYARENSGKLQDIQGALVFSSRAPSRNFRRWRSYLNNSGFFGSREESFLIVLLCAMRNGSSIVLLMLRNAQGSLSMECSWGSLEFSV